MTAPLAREPIIDALRRGLEPLAECDAAWIGGSAAFGALDEFSDVDLVAVVDDAAFDAVFAAAEGALEALSPIVLRHEVTGQPGFRQRFYRQRDASEFLVVDLALLPRSQPVKFLGRELHGEARILFDKTGALVEPPFDEAAERAAAAARVAPLRAAFELFQHLPEKELRRGRTAEAVQFYHAYTLRPLAEALRLRHRPLRRIFGLRYLERDLPPAVAAELRDLSFVADPADLRIKLDRARARFRGVIGELDRAVAEETR